MSTPSAASQRRLFKDLQKIRSEELSGPSARRLKRIDISSRIRLGINATPVDSDLRVWNALIDGPVDTCYEDGLFTLRMEFTGTRGTTEQKEPCISDLPSRYVSIDTAQRSIYV